MEKTCNNCSHGKVCGKLIWEERDGTVICEDFKDNTEYSCSQCLYQGVPICCSPCIDCATRFTNKFEPRKDE